MLFNSYIFIFVFFPIVFFVFFQIGKFSHSFALLWLAAASLFFYGWWDIRFVGLLLGSITFNYCAGYLIDRKFFSRPKLVLISAILINLLLLGYFKYANFFASNINHFANTSLPISDAILPLGISFFTFTQIAFLVDIYKEKVKSFNVTHYMLFVTYFPHLLAGPILHHQEIMPQFAKRNVCDINWNNIAVGLTIFALGLTKKVILADSLADLSSPIFYAAKMGEKLMLIEAWLGALSYTFQLYFDFSAYCDMAIGLSLMLNIRLPINFNSPYKATSIIEFWRCWHMTLSRFLRDYLYIPLGGNRNGKIHRYLNMMITMLLGGFWHGAGWTFLIWGGIHGLYLVINHSWRSFKQRMEWGNGGHIAEFCARALTFLAVIVGWVFFRSDNTHAAMTMLYGMAGVYGVSLPHVMEPFIHHYFPHQDLIVFAKLLPVSKGDPIICCIILATSSFIVWGLPNVQQIFRYYLPACEYLEKQTGSLISSKQSGLDIVWRPSTHIAWATGILFALAAITLTHVSEFLYFQF